MPQEPKGNNMKSFYKGAIFICVLTIGITFFNDILRDPLEVKPVNLTTNLAVLVVLLIFIIFAAIGLSRANKEEKNEESLDSSYDEGTLSDEEIDDLYEPDCKEYDEFQIENSNYGLIKIIPKFFAFKFDGSRDSLALYCESPKLGFVILAIEFDRKNVENEKAGHFDIETERIVDDEIIIVKHILNNKALINEMLEQSDLFYGNEEKAKTLIIDKIYKDMYEKEKEHFEEPMSLLDFKDALMKEEDTMDEWELYFDKDCKFKSASISYYPDEKYSSKGMFSGDFSTDFKLTDVK